MNIFGITTVEAALTGGEEWFRDLKKVIYQNYQTVVQEMKEFPEIYIAPLEGTYLLFMDLRNHITLDQIKDFTQNQCRLAVDYGEWFGENWKGIIRINLGTSPANVRMAVDNIKGMLNKMTR